ncbi:hypothetical protein KW798_02905 [Candidatus Parcubacteria bacterium]|nr:hypothetical protein [Candidatus Parcubacteria bacterium]
MPKKRSGAEYLKACAKAIALMDKGWTRLHIFNEGGTGLSFGSINGVLNRETRRRKGLPVDPHSKKPRGTKGSKKGSPQHATFVLNSSQQYPYAEVRKTDSFVSALDRRLKGYTDRTGSSAMPAPDDELTKEDIAFLERKLYT